MDQQSIKNIKELASKLNISVTTVSRVLNGKARQYRISKKTEKIVRDAAHLYGYSPNQFARGLKLDKSESIGVIVPDISNPFFAEIVMSIEKESKKKGFAVLIGNSGDDTEQEITLIDHFKSRKVDGIIVAAVGITSKHLEEVFEAGMPMVIIDRTFPGLKIPTITSDNYGGAYIATKQLLINNHKKIACIQGLNESQPNTERVKGFIDAMQSCNIPDKNVIVTGDQFSIESGYHQTLKLLKGDSPPTALFALNNLIALGVLQAVSELSLSIPGDVSLISFDEQTYSAFLNTPMSTIEQNKEKIGKISVEKLTAQIAGMEIDKGMFVNVETKLHERQSIKKMKK
ncbi:MAG TPA: LacI family DNA-binding transcriptional regulator [Prolixibacteraceae bacterium]|nr:LacI family DNA-binding transcriptional regulator [Prolixibacteraceae bacterium]